MKALALSDDVRSFCELVNQGIEAWVEAGKLLVKISERDSEALQKISESNPHLTVDVLLSFERIGRGEIYPYLLVDGSPGARKLCGLPYKTQVKLFNGSVDVVNRRGVHGFVTQRKKVQELTETQAARVFDLTRVRTAAEQEKLFRPKQTALPHARSAGGNSDSDEEADLSETPQNELCRLLLRAQSALLDARTALAMLQLDSPLDIHISRALTEVGHLRFAFNHEK